MSCFLLPHTGILSLGPGGRSRCVVGGRLRRIRGGGFRGHGNGGGLSSHWYGGCVGRRLGCVGGRRGCTGHGLPAAACKQCTPKHQRQCENTVSFHFLFLLEIWIRHSICSGGGFSHGKCNQLAQANLKVENIDNIVLIFDHFSCIMLTVHKILFS